MASALQANVAANTCTFSAARSFFSLKNQRAYHRRSSCLFIVRASSSDDSDCNDEECAPDKEVGKVSMEWLAGEKTRVVGTYPPRKQGWTGYVEKDTAGQTNIYSVEIQFQGNAGSSSDGAENTAAIAAGLALISVAAASSILLQVGKNSPPQVQTLQYSGPSLSYYINKFKPPESVQASAPAKIEVSSPSEPVQPESSPEVFSEVQVEPEVLKESSSENTVS
ncbi:uncharacterized protein DS421_18g628610 [Arachis hypogaea]|nr:uncharacterized protein DS421_18g628610 [Arachis hypogaea]